MTVEGVAAAAHLSRRQLERRFAAEAGTSPKALAVRARFEHVKDALAYPVKPNLADLALEFGFSDQAHLTRDFRRFSGRTPQRFAAEMQATRELLAGYHDAFLQDAESS